MAQKVRLHKHSVVFWTCLEPFGGWLNLVAQRLFMIHYDPVQLSNKGEPQIGKWMPCQESKVRALDAWSSWNACNASNGSNSPRSLDSASSPPRWSSSNRSRCQYSNGETSKCVLVADVWVKHEMKKLNFTRMRFGTKLEVVLDSRFVMSFICIQLTLLYHFHALVHGLCVFQVFFKASRLNADTVWIRRVASRLISWSSFHGLELGGWVDSLDQCAYRNSQQQHQQHQHQQHQ